METIKFIHCADLHIDSPFKGISAVSNDLKDKLYQSTFTSFNNIIELAIKEEVHCVIISGDIYDGADKSLQAQMKFRNSLKRLSDIGIPTYIVYGNHDPLDTWIASIEMPENVYQFGGEEVGCFPLIVNEEEVAHIYGISFPTKVVYDNLALQFERTDDKIPSIAVLHTNVGENTGHKPYAPGSIDDLKSKNMDYWALGHVHHFHILNDSNPAIVYPGNSQARNPRETGEKGCCLVSLQKNGDCEIEHIPTDVVRFHSSEVDLTNVDTLEDVIKLINDKCEEVKESLGGKNSIIRISLIGRCNVNTELGKGNNLEDITDQIRESFQDSTPWIWLEKIKLNTSGTYNIDELKDNNDFLGDVITSFEDIDKNENDEILNIRELLIPLYHTWQGQNYLDELTDDEILVIAKEARNSLLDQLVGDE